MCLALTIFLDVGIVEVQVAQASVGGLTAHLIAVVAAEVADHPEVEVVQRAADGQRVVLGV